MPKPLSTTRAKFLACQHSRIAGLDPCHTYAHAVQDGPAEVQGIASKPCARLVYQTTRERASRANINERDRDRALLAVPDPATRATLAIVQPKG
jgi:hypothetical protein